MESVDQRRRIAPEAIQAMLERVLERGVSLAVSAPVRPHTHGRLLVADLVDAAGETVAAWLSDHRFATVAAAAFAGQEPAACAASQMAEAPTTSEIQTYGELLNVCAALIISPSGGPVRLRRTYLMPTSVPPLLVRIAVAPKEELSFEAEIEGFGTGAFTLAIG